jgi:antibiotic biosynthesis monooxygenase (ABM) superfamily enzyme
MEHITFEESTREEKTPYSDNQRGLDKWFKENGLIYQNQRRWLTSTL